MTRVTPAACWAGLGYVPDRIARSGSSGSGGITTTGGSSGVSISLTPTGVTVGTYGDSTHVGQFTVNEYGELTFAQNVAISGGGGGAYVPMVTGAEPPVLLSDGAGSLILTAYTP